MKKNPKKYESTRENLILYAKRKAKQAFNSGGMEDPYIGERDLKRRFIDPVKAQEILDQLVIEGVFE